MSAKRGATGLRGILLVDKPAGLTSHDVVARVRRVTGEKRVGHAGTLDPMATGLLVVLIGPFTRLEPYLSSATKAYDAQVTFGAETDTDDAEGTVTRTADVPESVHDEATARAALAELLGESMQEPPAYSAIKVGGQTAHRVARAGGSVTLVPRHVTVTRAELLDIDVAANSWDVGFTVSKGTYVRALARDLGRAMGTAAHLTALRRTASGLLSLADAHDLDEIEAAGTAGTLPALFASAVDALGLPVLEVGDASDVMCGRTLPLPEAAGDRFAVVADGTLIAVYSRKGERLAAEAVFPILEETTT